MNPLMVKKLSYEFDSYIDNVYQGQNISQDQYIQLRQAFFGGCLSGAISITKSIVEVKTNKLSKEEGIKAASKICSEFGEVTGKLALGIINN